MSCGPRASRLLSRTTLLGLPMAAVINGTNNNNNGVSTCTSHAGADVTSTTALVLKESLPHDLWGAECPG